jgi:hypothetical protein
MKTLFIIPFVSLLVGCSILEPMPPSAEPTPVTMNLASILQGYRLPSQSITPSTNPDPHVDAAIHSMQRIAASQGLIFDGSRAAEGTVIVGRMGSTDQMVVAIAVYPKAGRVAMQDAYNWKASDMSEGTRMRGHFLDTLRQPAPQ